MTSYLRMKDVLACSKRFYFLFLALLVSCSVSVRPIYIDEEKKTAERAVEQFHERMNAEDYETIYDDANPQFRASITKDAAIAAMKQTHERVGKIIGVTQHWINYVMGDPIPVRAVYNIKCEKGEFSEWFTFVISNDGKKALLTQYQNFPGSSPEPKIK